MYGKSPFKRLEGLFIYAYVFFWQYSDAQPLNFPEGWCLFVGVPLFGGLYHLGIFAYICIHTYAYRILFWKAAYLFCDKVDAEGRQGYSNDFPIRPAPCI